MHQQVEEQRFQKDEATLKRKQMILTKDTKANLDMELQLDN